MSKRSLVVGLALGALILVGAAIAVYCLERVIPVVGSDFTFRLNEIDCLRQGRDPYDVWSGLSKVGQYVSHATFLSGGAGLERCVYTYPPWEYAYMMPFSFLPRNVSWTLYTLCASCLFVGLTVSNAFRKNGLIPAAVSFVTMSYLFVSDLQVGNFGVIVLVASFLMAEALNRNWDVCAGVLWAVAMVKPQLGVAFAIPLLWRGKWKTCIVAAVVCLGTSVIPSLMCGKSIAELILCVPPSNVEFFQGCGTWPYFLCHVLPKSLDVPLGLGIGVVVCCFMLWMLRKETDWLVFFSPVAIVSCCWSYAHSYCHAMGWFVAFVIVRDLVRHPQSKLLWALMLLSFLVLTRWFLAWHGLAAVVGWQFPMSEYAFRCVDSLNSTASLAIAFAYCVWKRK